MWYTAYHLNKNLETCSQNKQVLHTALCDGQFKIKETHQTAQ